MHRAFGATGLRHCITGLVGVLAVALPHRARAQGCMPLKFLSPGMAGLQSSYLRPHEWQVGISLRRVTTNKVFVGSNEDLSAAPGGQPLYLHLNSLDLSATYALSDRLSLTGSVPFSYSTASNIFPDGNRHQNSSAGVGDVNLVGNFWVMDPGSHVGGNVVVGLGMKAPTGRYHATDDFWTPAGVTQEPVPQTIQQGDGGWAILAQAQGYLQLAPRVSSYLSVQYSASLRQHTDVVWPPAGAEWAVPDVYSARGGFTYFLLPHQGLSLSAGGRIDGTTRSDLFHAAGDYYRHAGYTAYLEPGLLLIRGPNQFTITVPVRLAARYLSMQTSTGVRVGTGGVNDYLVYASFTRRL